MFPPERLSVISFLSGTVHRIAADHLVVLTYGVGRKVHVTPDTLAGTRHGAEIELVTTLVVREDSMTLFGFGTEDENHTFEVLLTISGIGPRLAMAILSVMGPDELAAAISGQDATALTRVPGIGKKGASRIILELENKAAEVRRDGLRARALSFGESTSRSSTPSSASGGRNPRPPRRCRTSSASSVLTPAPRHSSRPPSKSWVRGNDRTRTSVSRTRLLRNGLRRPATHRGRAGPPRLRHRRSGRARRRSRAPSQGLQDFIGQPQVREQLSLVLDAAKARAGLPTTSCSPDRPDSARRRWR